MNRLVKITAPILLFALVGCTDLPTSGASGPAPTISLSERTAGTVDQLLASVPGGVASNTTILITSIADINALDHSSTLGRSISEQAAARLIQRGYRIPEVRLANAMQVRPGGEFMLSDDLQSIRRAQDAGLVLTGTYGEVGKDLYVNLRLVRLSDGIAIGAAELRLSRELAYLN